MPPSLLKIIFIKNITLKSLFVNPRHDQNEKCTESLVYSPYSYLRVSAGLMEAALTVTDSTVMQVTAAAKR